MNNARTLLALDTSSTRTGWAFFIDGKYASSGVIDYTSEEAKKLSSDERIKEMCISIFETINTFHPDSIAIEKMTVSRNMTTVHVLSKIIGTVFAYAIQCDINYYEIEASQWRAALHMQKRGRKRDEYKKLSVQYAQKIAGKDITDDEADAICIGESFWKKELNVYVGN